MNNIWSQVYPMEEGEFRTAGTSNAPPPDIICQQDQNVGKKTFYVFNVSAQCLDLQKTVSKSWSRYVKGYTAYQVSTRLRHMKDDWRDSAKTNTVKWSSN